MTRNPQAFPGVSITMRATVLLPLLVLALAVFTIEDFLLNEFQSGALLGDKPEKAFFVKCDRSTMTQNDLDNGRLVCLIGVAPLRPAEFVIFRIGQMTASSKQ